MPKIESSKFGFGYSVRMITLVIRQEVVVMPTLVYEDM